MNPSFRPPAPEGSLGDCLVALVDARTLLPAAAVKAVEYLSAAEQRRYSVLPTAQRRSEWLAARVAAKYLFLQQALVRHFGGAQTVPNIVQLSDILLDVIPGKMYQEVEILADEEPPFAAPVLRWRGRLQEETVSLAHTGDDVCACLSTSGPVGVDLEKVTQRADAFYRCNFTETEREWVNQGARNEPLGKEWLFTLLWTIKEAALKARSLMPQSPWSFAGIGLEGLPVPQDVLWAFRQTTWRKQFGLFFTAAIRETQGGSCARVAFGGTRDLVLTVVKPIRALTSNAFRGGADEYVDHRCVRSEHP